MFDASDAGGKERPIENFAGALSYFPRSRATRRSYTQLHFHAPPSVEARDSCADPPVTEDSNRTPGPSVAPCISPEVADFRHMRHHPGLLVSGSCLRGVSSIRVNVAAQQSESLTRRLIDMSNVSLAHELAVTMMPEPSSGSKVLTEELGIEFDESAGG